MIAPTSRIVIKSRVDRTISNVRPTGRACLEVGSVMVKGTVRMVQMSWRQIVKAQDALAINTSAPTANASPLNGSVIVIVIATMVQMRIIVVSESAIPGPSLHSLI